MAIDLTGDQPDTETGPIELRLPPRSLLADDVYETLRDNLRAGRIPAGTRLNLDQLARDLHVSNTPVRQALAPSYRVSALRLRALVRASDGVASAVERMQSFARSSLPS